MFGDEVRQNHNVERGAGGFYTAAFLVLCALAATGCSKGNSGCDGPALNTATLQAIKQSAFTSGPRGFLVPPNPIDATHNANAKATDAATLAAGIFLRLPNLISPSRLESSFIKIRIHDYTDDVSTLATPSSSGDFTFQVSDTHYSEVMAYQAVSSTQAYIEALGFSVVKSRPLYVMVRATPPSDSPSSVNAYYEHNYLNPSLPRFIKLIGDTQFAPGADQDMYRHEFGHLINESTSREVGIDYAVDNGAVYTEASALHEALADNMDYSMSGKTYIGRWIARNFTNYSVGQPLRSDVDTNSKPLMFSTVGVNDGTGTYPERYHVAEWLTRVLKDIRTVFVGEESTLGDFRWDRVLYSAMSLLKKDTSISQFRDALISADAQLHCGGHESTIRSAFVARGFQDGTQLSQPVQIQAQATSAGSGSIAAGGSVTFAMRITNPNGVIARNVRVVLQASGAGLIPTTYLQGYGDLSPGQTLNIGSGALGYDSSLAATLDKSVTSGQIRYVIKILTENSPSGGDGVYQGVINL